MVGWDRDEQRPIEGKLAVRHEGFVGWQRKPGVQTKLTVALAVRSDEIGRCSIRRAARQVLRASVSEAQQGTDPNVRIGAYKTVEDRMPVMNNDTLAVNTLRVLALDAVAKAKEGHPGGPSGMSPMAFVLWTKIMRYNPRNPRWFNRDRFVLSAGHASMLLYGALHLTGYDLPLKQLQSFRQWDSMTPGHPEYGHAPGVETTTGPLGQGFATAVGMALAEAHLAARYNTPGQTVVDHFTYGICSDGDLQEGISHEAASFAGHLGLGKLIFLYDDNKIQLDGPTEWACSEDITRRFEAYGWQVLEVADGDHDLSGIEAAIRAAQAEANKPSLIRVKTTIGYGLPKQGTAEVHGKAPSLDDVIAAKHKLEHPNLEPFWISPDGAKPWREAGERGAALEANWNATLAAYRSSNPELGLELDSIVFGVTPAIAPEVWPVFDTSKPARTRNASQAVLNAIAPHVPALLGGSADLSSSNMTTIKSSGAMKCGDLAQRNINFGVREFAMAAIGNGMALSGLRPYVATFFTFSDYMKNAIRLAALMRIPTIFVFSHDSIGVGTDGPTHQPIEHLAALRAIPNFSLIRPSDANETAFAWKLALERTDGPTALVLTRQDIPTLAPNPDAARGGYVLSDSDGTPEVILIGTGSEVQLALGAQTPLLERGVKSRVVALPSWDVFARQPAEYRESVLPSGVRARVAIEAGSSLGWERFVGLDGRTVTIDRYGASAPDAVVFEKLGFTVDNVVKTALELLGRA
jgi:transketolase